jgi:hypothetical protein
LSADQQTLAQDEQQEAQDVAAGDYSAADYDAQAADAEAGQVAEEGGPDNTTETWDAALNESWADSQQQTAEQDQQYADSYAAAGFGDDAQMYSEAAANEEQTADNSAEAGEYGDPLGPSEDAPTDAGAEPAADEAPAAEEAPVEDDTAAVDDDSSGS